MQTSIQDLVEHKKPILILMSKYQIVSPVSQKD